MPSFRIKPVLVAAALGATLLVPAAADARPAAPAAPKALHARLSGGHVVLTWSAGRGSAKALRYQVARKAGTGRFARIATASRKRYTDKHAAGSTKLVYRVQAVGKAGRKSTPATATVTLPAGAGAGAGAGGSGSGATGGGGSGTGTGTSANGTANGTATGAGTTAGGTKAVSGRWTPTAGQSWQWQLSGALDSSQAGDVYDVDLFDTSAATVAALHAKGKRVVCYFSAGSSENWRPDFGSFPAAIQGAGLDGWPGEKWLDVRNLAALMPVMNARLDQCAAKGFDGVEADNVDGYSNASGFPLAAADQLAYNRALAAAAHARGLAIGLKNDLDQVKDLVASFDFAVNEQCVEYGECGMLKPFIAAGKPVFNAEYAGTTATVCSTAKANGLSTIIKNLALDAKRTGC